MTEVEVLREEVERLKARIKELEVFVPPPAVPPPAPSPAAQETDHPYIIRVPGVKGGDPITRIAYISVRAIVETVLSGETAPEVLAAYAPRLTAIEVADALSYYLRHQAEIDAIIAANEAEFARLAEAQPKVVESTDHPLIIRVAGVRGGEPITRHAYVSVRVIAALAQQGQTPEEIEAEYAPHLSKAEIVAALSYYAQHKVEVDDYTAQNKSAATEALKLAQHIQAQKQAPVAP